MMESGRDSKVSEDMDDDENETPPLVNKTTMKGMEVEVRDCDEEQQTGREIQVVITSWGIVKWK